MIASDFRVGQTVFVEADQGVRLGTVTKIGRTRVTVRHPRNQAGTMVERPYGLERIVVGQYLHPVYGDWFLRLADGESSRAYRDPVPGVPVVER